MKQEKANHRQATLQGEEKGANPPFFSSFFFLPGMLERLCVCVGTSVSEGSKDKEPQRMGRVRKS
jgi:hypothetical protein